MIPAIVEIPQPTLHALRRDRYCCQHRDAAGLKCNAPARRAGSVTKSGPLLALCQDHLP